MSKGEDTTFVRWHDRRTTTCGGRTYSRGDHRDVPREHALTLKQHYAVEILDEEPVVEAAVAPDVGASEPGKGDAGSEKDAPGDEPSVDPLVAKAIAAMDGKHADRLKFLSQNGLLDSGASTKDDDLKAIIQELIEA